MVWRRIAQFNYSICFDHDSIEILAHLPCAMFREEHKLHLRVLTSLARQALLSTLIIYMFSEKKTLEM